MDSQTTIYLNQTMYEEAKTTKINRTILILVAISLLIALTSVILFLILQIGQPEKIEVPAFTGAVQETISPDELNTLRQEQDLRAKVPIREVSFAIEFDYSKNKFVVSLHPAYDQSKTVLLKWLNDNGFGDIPEDSFEYYLD